RGAPAGDRPRRGAAAGRGTVGGVRRGPVRRGDGVAGARLPDRGRGVPRRDGVEPTPAGEPPQARERASTGVEALLSAQPRSGKRASPVRAARITRTGSRFLNLSTKARAATAIPAVGQSTTAPRVRTMVAPAIAPAAA